MVEQVFDPNLGEERDAFPGEVVPPEQEKTMQRLMREDQETFLNQFNPVIATGQLTPEEINAIQKAANIRAELKRKEYLDAIRQNPANIIQGILKECKPEESNIVMAMLNGLNNKVKMLEGTITSEKTVDQLKGTDKSTLAYMRKLSQGNTRLGNLLTLDFYSDYLTVDNENRPPTDKNREQIVFETLRKLGLVPAESLRSFTDLYSAVANSGNSPVSGKPYVRNDQGLGTRERYTLSNFSSNTPGLEGITASFGLSASADVTSVIISSTPEALARIIDRGQYVPYQQPTEQPTQQPANVVPEENLSEVNPQGQSTRARRIPKLPFLKRNKQ